MSFPRLRTPALYHRYLRPLDEGVRTFAQLRDASRFICISALLSKRSNKGEMHI